MPESLHFQYSGIPGDSMYIEYASISIEVRSSNIQSEIDDNSNLLGSVYDQNMGLYQSNG